MLKKIAIFLGCSLLAACVQQKQPVFFQTPSSVGENQPVQAPTVAVVLPLSGESAKVGESMKNAAMMSAFEHKNTPLKILFFDTESKADGAEQAYRWALAQKPDIVLGPVFSKEVAAIQKAGISVPLLTFTSDTTLMNNQVATMAVTVPEQVRQIVRHACNKGQKRLAVLGPDSKTGEIALNALADEVESCPGMTMKKVSLYEANTMNFTNAIKRILPADIDAKKTTASSVRARAGIDAIVVFEEGMKLRQLLSILAFYDAGPRDIPTYGLTLVKQVSDVNANSVYFADLDETAYRNFAREYENLFGTAPLRITSQMYDSVGWIFDQASRGKGISLADLKAEDSYWGVDGLVRLEANGMNKRSLQLKQKHGSRSTLIEAAETSFTPRLDSKWNAVLNSPIAPAAD
ncbi:MAG: penicillin-binding protein activator [Alphaproteobacteria bacterium]|nr:penicillin-binding protein activator [Alphaproteobacteria bacterium]